MAKKTATRKVKKAKDPKVKTTAKKVKKPCAKTSCGKPTKAAPAPAKKKGSVTSWLDEKGQKPVIDRYARQLTSFLKTMEGGVVDDTELADQEQRLVAIMKDVEPELNPELHGKITTLLCELTAYDIMHMLYSMQESRPKTVFRG